MNRSDRTTDNLLHRDSALDPTKHMSAPYADPKDTRYLRGADKGTDDEGNAYQEMVPLSIFAQQVPGLQAIVCFLHERKRYSFACIADLLHRDPRTIWATYAKAKGRKRPSAQQDEGKQEGRRGTVGISAARSSESAQETAIRIPLAIFERRDFSVLEHLCHYLFEQQRTYAQIARLLGKDQRTIWTVMHRCKKKELLLAAGKEVRRHE